MKENEYMTIKVYFQRKVSEYGIIYFEIKRPGDNLIRIWIIIFGRLLCSVV
jgi:hypothetical protein